MIWPQARANSRVVGFRDMWIIEPALVRFSR